MFVTVKSAAANRLTADTRIKKGRTLFTHAEYLASRLKQAKVLQEAAAQHFQRSLRRQLFERRSIVREKTALYFCRLILSS